MPAKLLFKPEVLELTGLSFATIWNRMRDGEFPLARGTGGKVAWLQEDIDAWIRSRPVKQYKPKSKSTANA
jgi:predicted DNA-binding transcriptional regulator AlpA